MKQYKLTLLCAAAIVGLATGALATTGDSVNSKCTPMALASFDTVPSLDLSPTEVGSGDAQMDAAIAPNPAKVIMNDSGARTYVALATVDPNADVHGHDAVHAPATGYFPRM